MSRPSWSSPSRAGIPLPIAALAAGLALALVNAPGLAAQESDGAVTGEASGEAVTATSSSEGDGGAQAARQDDRTLVLVRGTSTVVDHPRTLARVSIAQPSVADAVVVSSNEVVVNGKAPGQTTLLIWDEQGNRRLYDVRVTADAATVQRELGRVLPDAGIGVRAAGNTLIVSGVVRDPGVEERAMSLVRTLAGDASVVNQMTVPNRGQVMLNVRFAEVNRSALDEFGLESVALEDEDTGGAAGTGRFFAPSDQEGSGGSLVETTQDAVNFFLFNAPSNVQVFLNALQTRGLLRSLAEPTLMAVPGDTASFLAGGEFPFPVLQGGGTGGGSAVTIQFKEFGIRLNFVPHITNSGAIRLRVAPEVSQLDFSQGLEVSGFRVPALLTRRAATAIELSSGQTFAIAGLVDNTLMKTVEKVPLLGNIPILGELFRSEQMRQNRTELLVLVTPHIVRPTDDSPPTLPTGEPETWKWKEELRDFGSEGLPAGDSVESGPGGPGPTLDGAARDTTVDAAADTTGGAP